MFPLSSPPLYVLLSLLCSCGAERHYFLYYLRSCGAERRRFFYPISVAVAQSAADFFHTISGAAARSAADFFHTISVAAAGNAADFLYYLRSSDRKHRNELGRTGKQLRTMRASGRNEKIRAFLKLKRIIKLVSRPGI